MLIMNSIDQLLEVKNGSLVLAAAQLFAASISTLEEDKENFAKILNDFIDRIKFQISRFMNSKGNEPFKVSFMRFLEELPPEASFTLKDLMKDFEIKGKDGYDVSGAKVNLLSTLYFNSLRLDEDDAEFRDEMFEHLCQQTKSNQDPKMIQIFARVLLSIDLDVHKCQKIRQEDKGKVCSRVHRVFADKVLGNVEAAPIVLKQLFNQLHEDHDVDPEIKKKLDEILCEVSVFRICDWSESGLESREVTEFCALVLQVLKFIQNTQTANSPYFLEIILEDAFSSPSSPLKYQNSLYLRHVLLKQLCRTTFATMATFPPATQHILARVIRYLKDENVPEIEDLVDYHMGRLTTTL